MPEEDLFDIIRRNRRAQIWRTENSKTFESYVRTVRGDAFHFNWHHEMICEGLDKWLSGEWKRLMIFMPPDHGKTELTGRLLPPRIATMFGNVSNPPGIIYATHTEPLANRVNRESQSIMCSEEFRKLFPNGLLPGADGRRDERHVCNQDEWEFLIKRGAIFQRGAKYKCVGVGGALGGYDGHFTVCDDFIPSREKAESAAYRRDCWNWLVAVVMRRLRKPFERLLLTTTRWHPDDPPGRILQQIKRHGNFDDWKILTFPAIMDEKAKEDPLREFMPFEDPRDIGEALWESDSPYAKGKAYLDRVRLGMVKPSDDGEYVSPYDWEALYQQRPMSEESQKINIADFDIISPEEFALLLNPKNDEGKAA